MDSYRHATLFAGSLMAALLAPAAALAQAPSQRPASPPDIHIVYMGGNDCPPCVAWRREQLPKLEQTAAFKAIKFTYVVKSIQSAVPAGFLLPADVRPFKDKLDVASGGLSGSPQFAVMVNGEVYDYYSGTRAAPDMVKMIDAIRSGQKYPYPRCLQRGKGRSCVKRA